MFNSTVFVILSHPPKAGLMTSAQNNSLSSLHCHITSHRRKSPKISPNPGFDVSISSRVQWPCSFKGSLPHPTGLSPSPDRLESQELSPESTLLSRKNIDDSLPTSQNHLFPSLQKI